MDIRLLTGAIAQCIVPGSAARQSLRSNLEQLLSMAKRLKASNVEATSLLTHITLAAVRILGPSSVSLSDKECELCLECLYEALTLDDRKQYAHMSNVHAIIIDHLSRVLIPLFALESAMKPDAAAGSIKPEPTRLLAIKCWSRLFTGISTVYIPQNHSSSTQPPMLNAPSNTLPFNEYIQAYLPADYLSLAVCALLDNAELSDDQQLRLLALDTLAGIMGKGTNGVLCKSSLLQPILPGIISALARVALAKTPAAADAKSRQDDHDGFINDMANVSISGSGHRKYPASVRSRSIDCIRIAVLVVFERSKGQKHKDSAAATALIEDMAQKSKADLESVIQGTTVSDNADGDNNEEGKPESMRQEPDGAGEFQNRLLQILRRLATLRHTEHLQVAKSLFALFAAVSLDCSPPLSAQCFSVAVEVCLIIAGSKHSFLSETGGAAFIGRLAEECKNHKQGIVYQRIAGLLESSLSLFDQYVVGGAEQQRADILYLISGYMRVLGQSETQSLLNPWWATRGLHSFLASLAISLPGTSLLISELSADDASLASRNSKTQCGEGIQYVLDYYRTQSLKAALDAFIDQLADTFSVAGLCSQLLALLARQNTGVQSQTLWLLSRVVPKPSNEAADSAAASGSNIGSICEPMFQYCLDHFGRHESSYGSDGDGGNKDGVQKDEAISRYASTDGVLHSCVVLNAISAVIPAVGPGVAYYMDTLLFPLLQMSTAALPVLQHETSRALSILASTTGYPGIPQMLQDNVDYIIEGCSRKLALVEIHPEVFDILVGSVKLLGKDILVYMDDVVEDTLDACESLMDDESVTVGALKFLEVVTQTVAFSVHADRTLLKDNRKAKGEEGDSIDRVLAELQELEAQQQMMEFINIEDDDGDDENGQQLQKHDQADVVDEEKEEEAGNPLAIKITLVVQNFLSTSSDSQQLLALKILQNTLHALTDTRDVLPLINEVWPALSHRLNKGRDSFYVTLAACDVVSTACRIGEGWMRQRVRDDLWLHFRRILHDTEPQSVVQRSSDCELVRRVLATMQTVVECVPVDEAIAWDLAWLSLRFVSQKPVEDHAVGLLKAMVPMHGDKIWLILAKLGRTSISPDSIPHLGIPETIRTPEDICRKLDLQI